MEYQKTLENLDPNSTDNFSCSVMEKSSKSAVLENQQDIKVIFVKELALIQNFVTFRKGSRCGRDSV